MEYDQQPAESNPTLTPKTFFGVKVGLSAIIDPQKRLIVASILENGRISREGLANKAGVSESTIKRRLKEWDIYWEGHPKTGHWVIPDKLTKSS